MLWRGNSLVERNAIHIDDAVSGEARSSCSSVFPSEEEGSGNSEGKFSGDSRVERQEAEVRLRKVLVFTVVFSIAVCAQVEAAGGFGTMGRTLKGKATIMLHTLNFRGH